MLYRVDTGSNGTLHTECAMGVNCHHKVVVLRRFNHGFQLLIRELRVIATLGKRQDTPGHRQFNNVTPVLVSLSYRFVSIIRAVNHAIFWSGIATQICPHPVRWIRMTTRGRHCLAGRENSGTRHNIFCDGITQCKAGLNVPSA